MAITAPTPDIESEEVQTPLLNDFVLGAVGFNGLPADRSKSGRWRSASFIIGVEVAERVAYYGISSNLISYMTGPLNQSTAAAAENVNAWNGAALLLPLFGAFVADSFLGRYRTIVIASLLYILGLGLLTLSAAIHSSNSCNPRSDANKSACSPPLLQVVIFFFSLYLVSLAQSGHKPCVQAFGADQFDEEDKGECKAKSSFFNWWYFSMNGGIVVALLVLTYIQENMSWELGFGIPCIFMCLALFVFLLGSMSYRFHVNSDERNPFVRIGRVFVRAAKNWKATPKVPWAEERVQQTQADESTKFEFLNKALVIREGQEEARNACSVSDVADARAILRFLPIWCACLGFGIVSAQDTTMFTKQGATLDRHLVYGLQIPAASLLALDCLSVIGFVPIYDLILVPVARALTKKPAGITKLQRIGTGLFLSFLSMVTAALVERRRLATAVKHGLVDKPNATIPMSIWWLAPQYILLGLSNVFAMVGLQEFFYDEIPSALKSVGLGLYLSIFGIGCLASSLMISVIEKATSGDGHESWFSNNLNRAHLDYFYLLLAGLSAVAFTVYAYFAKSYMYNSKGN